MKRKAVYAVIAAAVPSTFLIAGTVGATAVVGYGLDVENMPLVRTIDERYMSFQIGMSHLTGGETWSTYDASKQEGEAKQAENFEAVREARAPTDLTNPRLRTLTAALAPLSGENVLALWRFSVLYFWPRRASADPA